MKEHLIDPERLAAFLDGRVREPERSALLSELASSDQAFDAFVDVSAVMAEMHSTGGAVSSRVRQNRVTTRWRPLKWVVVAAAASVLVVATVQLLATRGRNAPAGADAQLLALVGSGGGALDSGFYRTSLWPATRGASTPMRPEARAVRLGVRLADLGLSSTGVAASDIAEMLDGIAGAGAAAAWFRELPSSDGAERRASVEMKDRARQEIVQFADAELVDAGFGLEITRAAAAERNASFFAAPATAAMLTRIAALPAVRSQAPNELGQLQALGGSAAKPDWERVERAASDLIRLLAS